VRRAPSLPRTCSPGRSRSARPFSQQIAWSQAPVLVSACHSNATHPKEVLGFMFEKLSQPGAPLRNRTVDLLLTMDNCAVLQPQVDRLTCANTSTHWHSQALDEPTRAPFATQSATHFDLADEPSYEVIDIQFDDQGGIHSRSQSAVTPANCLRSARRDVQGWTSNATQTVLERGGHRPIGPFAQIADSARQANGAIALMGACRSPSYGLVG
jgi:hypothetical protein